LLASFAVAETAQAETEIHWIDSWSAAPDEAGPVLQATTIREVVRTSVGGSSVRIRLSNLYGKGPLTLGPVHIARHAAGSAIEPGSDHALAFDGKPTVTIAKGGTVLSDPLDMPVTALQELAISIYIPMHGADKNPSTIHGVGMERAYLVRGRDDTTAIKLESAKATGSRFFLVDVEVAGSGAAGTVVAMGSSITDGVGSTLEANGRWPDALSVRLQTEGAPASMAVINSGVAGNRLLQDAADPFRGQSALGRMERDVLSKPGVRWVILEEGINDIAAISLLGTTRAKVSARQIIEGLQTLVSQAHAKGIKVAGGTLLPYAGITDYGTPAHPYFTAAGEATRQEINKWIRSAGAFDAVADFDQALRDPARPDHLLPAFDSGDHLHPNDAGYKAMANAIDLHWFAGSKG
jgi:lysophospholipase L1-like esterase